MDDATATTPAAEARPGQDTGAQYVVFKAREAVFAISLGDVLEVIEPEWWVRIPHAASWVEGVLYHHGDPLVVANAGSLLCGARASRKGTASVLRLRVHEMKLGILVDRVLGTWQSATPATPSRETGFIKGVWDRKGNLVNLIDFDALLDRASRIFAA